MLWQERLKQIVFDWLLPILTGTLLGFAYPPHSANQLAWIGLLPLLFAVLDCPRGAAFRRGYVAGLVFFGMTVWWTIHVTLPGMVALVAVLALYCGLAGLWFNELLRRFSLAKDGVAGNLLVVFAGTAGWVTLEWIRGKFLFGGFGWNGLGVSQYKEVVLIQVAEFTGVYGVSALVCLINLAMFFTVRRLATQFMAGKMKGRLSWELYLAMGIFCVALVGGYRLTKRPVEGRQLRVALVQANIPQTLKFDPSHRQMILSRYQRLTEAAAVMKPELIVWPETATPDALRFDPDSLALVTNMATQAGAYLLTGTFDATSNEMFNAAALVRPDGRLGGMYHKMHLVVFGEYVPLRKILPFLKHLTPIGDSFERGREPKVFEIGGENPFHIGTVICFEDTVPDLYAKFVARGVDFMVNLTNDAWFKDSPAASLHLANAVFRAVETRRPLIRATNNGVTCVVDVTGYVAPETRLNPFVEEMRVSDVAIPYRSPLTFYVRYGDWFVGVCALLSVLLAGGFAWQSRRARRQDSTAPAAAIAR